MLIYIKLSGWACLLYRSKQGCADHTPTIANRAVAPLVMCYKVKNLFRKSQEEPTEVCARGVKSCSSEKIIHYELSIFNLIATFAD